MTIPAKRIAIIPLSLIASANAYGEYMNININAISNDGVLRTSMYLKSYNE